MAQKRPSSRTTPPKPKPVNVDQPVTTAQAWKKKAQEGTALKVPSGNVALVKNPGLPAFLRAGMIPNSLMPLVERALNQGKEPSKTELQNIMVDPAKLDDAMRFMDLVVVHCVMEPQVQLNVWTQEDVAAGVEGAVSGETIPAAHRDPEALYVDEVDFDDRVFIFQWVLGGTRDVESFRAGFAESMEGLSPS